MQNLNPADPNFGGDSAAPADPSMATNPAFVVEPLAMELPANPSVSDTPASATVATADTIVTTATPVEMPMNSIDYSMPQMPQMNTIVGETPVVVENQPMDMGQISDSSALSNQSADIAQVLPVQPPTIQAQPEVNVSAMQSPSLVNVELPQTRPIENPAPVVNNMDNIMAEPIVFNTDQTEPVVQESSMQATMSMPQEASITQEVPSAPISTEINPQLSSIFDSVPSDISFESPTTPTISAIETMAMPTPPMNTGENINIMSSMPTMESIGATAVMANSSPVNMTTPAITQNQVVTKVHSNSILRFIIWFAILLLGVLSLVLGIYFAQLIDIPFLDPIFRG